MDEATLETMEFDIRGQICPSTLLTALRTVNQYREQLRGGTLRLMILTDNRAATNTIPEAVRNMGYAVAVHRAETGYCIAIEGNIRG